MAGRVVTARLTWSLFAAAAIALALDALAFVAWIVPGHAFERNPLIAPIDPLSALLAKAALVVLLGCLTVILAGSRLMAAVLGLAVVSGLLGFASTLASVLG